MTDKQIIIYKKECYNEPHCSLNQVLEQLKRKEQECEELKIYIESNEQQVKYVETLVMDNDRLINELDQLKAENDELKKQLMQKSEVDMFFNIPIEGWSSDPCGICKYKNCLTEIKEIAETAAKCMYATYSDDYTEGYRWLGSIILQKISECEDNQ